MALYSFDLTIDSVDYPTEVVRGRFDMGKSVYESIFSITWSTPFGDTTQEKSLSSGASEMNAALSTLGSQAVTNAGSLKTLHNKLCEQLAKDKWGD